MLPLAKIEGKYEVVRLLNEGGMGVLYLVRHRQLDELRVIKVLRAHLTPIDDLRDRFLREAKAAIKLKHPNITQLYDFSVDDDGSAFMVLEFIDGVTLEQFCEPERLLPLPLSIELAIQTLRALGYLHARGFVHRDVAPDNLMMTEDVEGAPLVKLLDLGIVKSLAEGSKRSIDGMFLGKPRYASPEQLQGKSLDARSDLYAFGIVLFELLTGRYPFPGDDFATLATNHLQGKRLSFAETDLEHRVPLALRWAVDRALARDREERFASAEEFATTLAAAGIAPWNEALGSFRAALALREPLVPPRVRTPGPTQAALDRQFRAGYQTPAPLPSLVDDDTGPVPIAGSLAAVEEAMKAAEEALAADDAERAGELLDAFSHDHPLWDLPADLQIRFHGLSDRIRSRKVVWLLARARAFLELGSTVEAEYELDLAARIDPRHEEIRSLRGQSRERRLRMLRGDES